MIKLEFRLAEREDLDNIFDMFKDAINEMKKNGIDQWDNIYPDRNILEDDIAKKELYIGVSEDAVLSAYVLNQECDEQYANGTWKYPNSTYYVIDRLCVNPKFQNKGIGTSTMEHIENEVGKMGIDTIRLDAFTLNPHAVKLYEKSGFSKVGFTNWRKGKFHLMEKKINSFKGFNFTTNNL
ncbi:GNAT family N-acetyltransferase [Clostridium oceanicum]|uniref:GNAT family N-acetyltransferase n=1 Tax=Clostridium oceanicum TaxID=1543 RepID=A0ABN1JBS4_9CLOT